MPFGGAEIYCDAPALVWFISYGKREREPPSRGENALTPQPGPMGFFHLKPSQAPLFLMAPSALLSGRPITLWNTGYALTHVRTRAHAITEGSLDIYGVFMQHPS